VATAASSQSIKTISAKQEEPISTEEAIAEMGFYKAQLESAATMLEIMQMIQDRESGKN